jgi:ATP-dependent exoDNAse (exonuclease V) alpha subunit
VALTSSGDGVLVVRSAAGTGKTFALDAAVEAWRRSGVPVLGCGLSARAACELRDQAGIDATTIARLVNGLERGAELASGAVLIVDEAGMVGTRDLAALAEAARDSNAKLVLVGDDCQLPEIEARRSVPRPRAALGRDRAPRRPPPERGVGPRRARRSAQR